MHVCVLVHVPCIQHTQIDEIDDRNLEQELNIFFSDPLDFL